MQLIPRSREPDLLSSHCDSGFRAGAKESRVFWEAEVPERPVGRVAKQHLVQYLYEAPRLCGESADELPTIAVSICLGSSNSPWHCSSALGTSLLVTTFGATEPKGGRAI